MDEGGGHGVRAVRGAGVAEHGRGPRAVRVAAPAAEGRTMPRTVRMTVVLPAPLRPSSA